MNKLPDKPSELITLALKDEDKAHKSKKYKVAMNQWHKPNGICRVCLAGSVMAFSLDQNRTERVVPSDYDYFTKNRLYALDYFRQGSVWAGLNIMGIDYDNLGSVRVRGYKYDRLKFRKDMRGIVKLLKSKGL